MVAARGQILMISTYMLLTIAVMSTIGKVTTKWLLVHHFQLDDLYIILAIVCTVGYSAALEFQVRAGLSQSITAMTVDATKAFGQAEYALGILYVASLGLAKWAVLEYMSTLARSPPQQRASRVVTWINILKSIATIFALSFQCPMPTPWNLLGDGCFNRTAFWTAFGCLDIAVDLATIALSIYLICHLNMPLAQRTKAIVAFSLRAIIIPVAFVRIALLQATRYSEDRPRTDFSISITTSVHIILSIITSCVPFLKRVFQNLSNGLLGAGLPAFRVKKSIKSVGPRSNGSYQLDSAYKRSSSGRPVAISGSAGLQEDFEQVFRKIKLEDEPRGESIEHLIARQHPV